MKKVGGVIPLNGPGNGVADVPRQPDAGAPIIPGYVLSVPLRQGTRFTVWKAVQTRTGRTVAVRVFSSISGVNWPFLRQEVARLVLLDRHPNVLSLLDADLDHHPPYDVAEFMDGGSLESFVNPGKRVKAQVVTRWMDEIAHALVFAHGKGIIHGDLKPANVLLDSHGWVRVTEFGQARVLTEAHGALGSLCYMAPEQAHEGEPPASGRPGPAVAEREPDVRWDLYALGAIAYALLTGQPPHAESVARNLHDMPDLSSRLALYRKTVAAHSLRPLRFVRYVDPDLAAIVRKCLEPDPARRYGSALEVVHDLENRRVHRPVSPLARSPVHRVRTLARRNPAVAILAVVALLLLATGWYAARMTRDADLVRALRLHAVTMTRLGRVEEAATTWAELNRRSPSPGARANVLAAFGLLPTPLARLAQGDDVISIAWNPAGTVVATGAKDGQARLWNTATGQPIGAPLRHQGRVVAVAFSHDGRRVITGSWDKTARVWDAATGQPVGGVLRHGGEVTSVAFSPDGRHVATGSADHTIGVWVTDSGKAVGPVRRHLDRVSAIVFNRDGLRVAAASWDGTGQVWCARRTMHLGAPLKHAGRLNAIAFSPDGKWVVTGSADHTARIWKSATGKPVGMVLQHQDEVTAVAYSPDGTRIVSVSADHTARVWDAVDGAPVGGICRHDDEILAVAFSPDGRWIGTGGKDGMARIWEASTGEPAGVCRHDGWVTALAFSPDGRTLAVAAGAERVAQLWDISRVAPRVRRRDAGESGVDVKIAAPLSDGAPLRVTSPDGRWAAVSAADRSARVVDTGTGNPVGASLPQSQVITALCWSHSGEYLAVRDGGDLVRIWAVPEGIEVGEPLRVGSRVTRLQFGRDDRTLVASGDDAVPAQVWATPWLAERPSAQVLLRESMIRTRSRINRLGQPERIMPASFN